MIFPVMLFHPSSFEGISEPVVTSLALNFSRPTPLKPQ
jgi:hypothetical protein